jgi:mRNA interferase MazF
MVKTKTKKKTRGKIYLVPFPFDDYSGAKARPAACLTNPIGPYRQVVLAFIGSQIPPQLLRTDILLPSHHADFGTTGL